MKSITEMWAWVCIDENGDEAIPTFRAGRNVLPCIGAERARVESLRPLILEVVAPLRPVKLVRFSKVRVVEVVRHEQPLDS